MISITKSELDHLLSIDVGCLSTNHPCALLEQGGLRSPILSTAVRGCNQLHCISTLQVALFLDLYSARQICRTLPIGPLRDAKSSQASHLHNEVRILVAASKPTVTPTYQITAADLHSNRTPDPCLVVIL